MLRTVPVVQLLSHVQLFAITWTAAHQASLSFPSSQSLLQLISIKSVMPSNHLILCCPLFLLPSIFLSIRVFSNKSALRIRWPKYWSFSFSTSPFLFFFLLYNIVLVLPYIKMNLPQVYKSSQRTQCLQRNKSKNDRRLITEKKTNQKILENHSE